MTTGQTIIAWLDGVFDLTHYGHFNAIRQGLQFGSYIIVGLHNDHDVTVNKGPPVLTQDERATLIKACRWTDQVVCNAPYTTDLDFIKSYNVDYVVHGDDISTDVNGLDAYRHVKAAGLYRECTRTRGVSTTDLISRLLGPELRRTPINGEDIPPERDLLLQFAHDKRWDGEQWEKEGVTCVKSLKSFQGGKTVYLRGKWDATGKDDIKYLSEWAKEFDNVVVGIDTAQAIYERSGTFPILTLKERTLAVLALRDVTAVVSPSLDAVALPFKVDLEVTIPDSIPSVRRKVEDKRKEMIERQKWKGVKSAIEKDLEKQRH